MLQAVGRRWVKGITANRACAAYDGRIGRGRGVAARGPGREQAAPFAGENGSWDRGSRTRLGFKGAMVHGPTNGVFLDDRRFWPIFERAQALHVPLYLHPAVPHRAVVETYYRDYLAEFPSLLTAAWGH